MKREWIWGDVEGDRPVKMLQIAAWRRSGAIRSKSAGFRFGIQLPRLGFLHVEIDRTRG